MTYLMQDATPIADAAKFSQAIWFRIPSSGGISLNSGQQYLSVWGGTPAEDLLKVSRTFIHTSSNLWRFHVYAYGGAVDNPLPPPPYFGMLNRWEDAGTANLGTETLDEWHCLGISYDGSQGVSAPFQGLSPNPQFKLVLDGALRAGTAFTSPPASVTFNGTGRTSFGAMYVNGFNIGVPFTADQLDPEFQQFGDFDIEFALFQMWFGQAIDWSNPVNYQKIAREVDGKLYPAGGIVAADAFGTPDVWFERDSVSGIKFEENRGTAGTFTLSGTAPADFDPGPVEDPPDAP